MTSKSSKSKYFGIGILLSASLALSACGSSVGVNEEDGDTPLKIGFIVPATGPVSSAGLAMQAGFELAVKEINENGGVNGTPVEYEVQDDGGDPATSTQIAQRYAQDPEIDMLFGTITGDTGSAVGEVSDQNELPFATVILGDPPHCSAYAWPFGESNMQLALPMVESLIENYGPRIAFAGSDYNFPHDMAEIAKEVIEDQGGELVAEEYAPQGTTDFESTVRRLAAAEPDAILSYIVGSDAIAFTQQAAEFGLLTTDVGYIGAPVDADYFPAVADQVEGREHIVRWSDGIEHPDSQAFVDAYRDETDNQGPVAAVAGNAYFAMQFIAAALNDHESNSSADIQEALENFSYDSPLGDGTHFITGEEGSHLFQANMFKAQAGETYEITEDLGILENMEPTCG